MAKFLNKKIISAFAVVVILSFFSQTVFAVWNGTFYDPGDTLNPECLPTDVDCNVRSPLTAINIDDTAYGVAWDTDTTHAPSKNAVYDKIEGLVAGSHDPVTLGTANGLSLIAQVLSLGLASTNTTGALSDTDWNTFNNKQNALTADLDYLTPGTATSTYEPLKGLDDNYVTDAEKTIIGNTSGTNTGDNAVNTLYSGLVSSQWATAVNDIYYNTGNVGIGTATPRTKLELGGDGAILATGTFGSGWTEPNLGAGTRMMWYPRKAAFRAGYVSGTQWNNVNIGDYSTGLGYDTRASGFASLTSGLSSVASGSYAVAFGQSTTASNQSSTAIGQGTTASGPYSTAMGRDSTASAWASTAMGWGTTANSYASTVIGQYNVGGGTAGSWVATDPLFEIGIGASSIAKANALTVLKNGNVGIGTATPTEKLNVTGNILATGTILGSNLSGTNTGDQTLAGVSALSTDTAKSLYTMTTNVDVNFVDDGGGTVLYLDESTKNVGIGTTNPGAKLDVVGNMYVRSGNLYTDNLYHYIGGSTPLNLGNLMYLRTDTGNVGIGTTNPQTLLHVAGEARFDSNIRAQSDILMLKSSSNPALKWYYGDFQLDYNSANILYAKSTGNVGIGTATPTEKLNVTGNILATGTVLGSNLSGTNTGDQDLSGYVPYTGANSNLDLGNFTLTTPSVLSPVGTALGLSATAPTATTGPSQAGIPLTISSSNAVASTDTAGAAAGGSVTITAGNAARLTSGNAKGGDISLLPGAGIGTGTAGVIKGNGNVVFTLTGDSANFGYISTGRAIIGTNSIRNAGAFITQSTGGFGISSTTLATGTPDVILLRKGAANPIWGLPSATPVAYTHSLSSDSRGGTDTNIAGANATIQPGMGTGSATPSNLYFSTADVGASGTTLQTATPKMTILGSGYVGIGTTAPSRNLDILNSGNVQLRLTSATDTVYSEFYGDSAGDLRISSTAGNVRLNNENLFVCSGGSCASTVSGAGNLVVETGITLDASAIISLGENSSIMQDPALSADGKYNGITRAGVAGAALSFGDLVYLDPTDSRWELADANAVPGADGDATGILGMVVLAAAGDGDPTVILLNGTIRADASFPTMTVNETMYASETPGDITATQPTTTDAVIKIIGFPLTADELYFNPSNEYFTHI